jgi:Fe-S cluster assembly ATP-binding protein
MLDIKNLTANIDGTRILNGIDLNIPKGKVVAVMGPNGSGKSTLASSLAGHPKFEVQGEATFLGEDLLGMEADERARAGLFLSFQYPVEVQGVTVSSFLKAALDARMEEKLRPTDYFKRLKAAMQTLKIPTEFASRYLNVGFSGGEKKRLEMLQMLLLEPKLAMLDETDSGLDIDALRIVSDAVNAMRSKDRSFLLITHYTRILTLIEPDEVAILMKGRIAQTGGPELAQKLEDEGYAWIEEHHDSDPRSDVRVISDRSNDA